MEHRNRDIGIGGLKPEEDETIFRENAIPHRVATQKRYRSHRDVMQDTVSVKYDGEIFGACGKYMA